jgi:glycosyltransferase involved in cell wall biosynthesis
MKVALVHDWLTGMRGGEKVLEAIAEIYPQADLFTLVHVRGSVSPAIESLPIRTSFIQQLPAADRLYRHYLPLFPVAVEQFDLREYDLVISSSHCAVKAVIPQARARHVCYCHSPMRYAWDQFGEYFGTGRTGRVGETLYRPVMAWLARWDASTAPRVHRFLANSAFVASRIRRYYGRDATVLYPPVDTEFYHPGGAAPGDVFLVVSALVPYKRVDLAIAACRRSGAALRIVGEGPDRERLERQANGTVTFLGRVSDEAVREEYRRARAVILPGTEDFGIVPVEAQACGRPVVAFARGGALESVVDGVTGTFFATPSVDSLADALSRLAAIRVDAARIRENALRFSRTRFVRELQALIAEIVGQPPDTRW